MTRFLARALIAEGEDIRRFGQGSTHTTIYFPEAKALHIALPSVEEQRRVVTRIDRMTARAARAREHVVRTSALVARAKQAVIISAFRGTLTDDWRQANPDRESVEALLAEVPAPQKGRGGRKATTDIIEGVGGISVNAPNSELPGSRRWVSLRRLARGVQVAPRNRRIQWKNVTTQPA